jgi:hypothetical protein
VVLTASNGTLPDAELTFTLTVNEAPVAPGISGPTAMNLTEGYGATSTGVYTVTGTAPVTVTKTSGDAKITWNSGTKQLDIDAGLAAGSYPVVLTASNGTLPDATLTFTLTVNEAPVAPGITGPTTMNLTEGYSATSTGAYTVTGTAPVTVTKTSGDAKITWNSGTKQLDIAAGLAAGSYPVVLTASNGTLPDATLTFTLTINAGATTIEVVEVPDGVPSPDLIDVEEVGDAFDQSVEVRIQDSPSAGEEIREAIRESTGLTDISNLQIFPLDISVYITGTTTRVQPNPGTSVKIICPIPAEYLENLDQLVVVCMGSGALVVLPTQVVLVNGVYCVQFTATHFSSYALVGDKSALVDDTVTVVTRAVSDVTSSTATLNGKVTTGGGTAITERGFVWGKAAHPVIGGSGITKTATGSGAGSFSTDITGLDDETAYYVRAYAISGDSVSYGDAVRFVTDELDDIPITGDNSIAWVWWILGGISAMGIGLLLMLDKRKKAYRR